MCELHDCGCVYIVLLFRYIFYFLFEICACNSFILLKRFGARSDYKSRTGYKQFQLELANLLIGNYNSRKRYLLPTIPSRKRSTPKHFPTKGKKGKCHYCCKTLHVRHESSIRCTTCDVPLCLDIRPPYITTCFELYHTY